MTTEAKATEELMVHVIDLEITTEEVIAVDSEVTTEK